MSKEQVRTMRDKVFPKRKEWVWSFILIFGGMAVALALCVDMDKIEIRGLIDTIFRPKMRAALWQASETICNTVVTYSTMLVAIVVFFYSMIDSKRLGVPYRRLIKYTIGSHTIPVLFMAALLLSFFVLVARCIPLKYTTYVCVAYILVIQIFAIIEILRSTSYKHCKRVICRIERKRYIEGIGLEEEFNTEWAYSFGHLERAIHSEEFIPDKVELLIDFLWIPFCRRTGKLRKRVTDRKKLSETEQLDRIYQFYFVNILSAFQNFDGDAKHLERNQLYRGIRSFILELSEKNSIKIKEDKLVQQVYQAALSGIMNGLISSNVEDNVEFCSYVLLQCISDKEAGRRQMYLFVLFQEMLSMIGTEQVSERIKVRNLGGWNPVGRKDVAYCAKFWEIWNKMYNFSFVDSVGHFEAAIQTMSGRQNASVTISKMVLTMTEKG